MTDNIVFRASKQPVNDVTFYFGATENPWKFVSTIIEWFLGSIKYINNTALSLDISGN